MSQEDDLDYLDIPEAERLASAAAAHLAREFLPIPRCPRRVWVNRPTVPISLVAWGKRLPTQFHGGAS